MPDALPDRHHNREEDSPEALRQSIEALAEAIARLDSRLDDAALGLKGEIIDARSATRRLAVEVENMGQVLVRRLEPPTTSFKPKAVQQSKTRVIAIAVLLILLSAAAIVVFASKNDSALVFFQSRPSDSVNSVDPHYGR